MRTCVIITVFVIAVCNAGRYISTDDIDLLIRKAFHNELSDAEKATLVDVLELLRRPESASRAVQNTGARANLECIVCRSAFSALFQSVAEGQTDDQLSTTIAFFCTALGIESTSVCDGAVALHMPVIRYIIYTTPEATPGAFCGLLLQNNHDRSVCPITDPRFDYTVDLPAPSDDIGQPVPIQAPLTIGILTDAHLDPGYESGGVADCDAPTCCRKGQTPATRSRHAKTNVDESLLQEAVVIVEDQVMLDLSVAPKVREMRILAEERVPRNSPPAGHWGDYRDCDTPIWAYDDVIDTMSENHRNIDVIYYIGDTIDHHSWETTYEGINDMNRYVVEKIGQNFGPDVPVIPVVGNHEAQPTNQFAPPHITGEKINTTWLYDALADKWGSYLSDEAVVSLRHRGQFSVLVRPGLRAISMNNIVAYRDNWWIVYDPQDAKNHLEWLVDELYRAERAGEKVHILAHIPPGVADLTYYWTREYNRIINRFSTTIVAEFNGHTHSDEFKVFYSAAGEPSAMAWGGGSATTYSHYNLNYKVATFNPDTFATQSIVNYAYNLTEANLTPERRPHWFQLYNMTNSFSIPDLTPVTMDNLVTSMVSSAPHLLDMYSAFYSKLGDNRLASCDAECKIDNLCKTVVTVLWERERCERLREHFYSRS